jgi:hypothetical protein
MRPDGRGPDSFMRWLAGVKRGCDEVKDGSGNPDKSKVDQDAHQGTEETGIYRVTGPSG